jgi:hypothetical protein
MVTLVDHHRFDDDGGPPLPDDHPAHTEAVGDGWLDKIGPALDAVDGLAKRGWNWDGERGLPARPDAIDFLNHRVLQAEALGGRDFRAGQFRAELSNRGEIVLDHKVADRRVLLNIPCEGVVEYCRLLDADTEVRGVVHCPRRQPIPAELIEVFQWLHGQ